MTVSALKTNENSDVLQISTLEGPVFYIRLGYLELTEPEEIAPEKVFDAEKEEDIVNAGLCFAAERKAEEFLARCEQCRAGLESKLINRGHDRLYVKKALDYLENRGLLSDKRFAFSWVRSHTSLKPQGKTRLLSELCAKGIKSSVAKEVLNVFFSQYEEIDLCRKALEKAVRNGKTEEKLLKFMIDSGFSYKMINEVRESQSEKLSGDC